MSAKFVANVAIHVSVNGSALNLTLPEARKLHSDLARVLNRPAPLCTFSVAKTIVAGFYGFTVEDIEGDRRPAMLARARHTCMTIARRISQIGSNEAGRIWTKAGVDHTVFLYAEGRVAAMIKCEKGYQAEFDHLLAKVRLAVSEVSTTQEKIEVFCLNV